MIELVQKLNSVRWTILFYYGTLLFLLFVGVIPRPLT